MAGESKLQSKIIKIAEKAGWLVMKIKLCSKNGWPDLVLIRFGRVVWIEVKDEGEVPDPLQDYRHQEIRDHGGEVYAVDTFEAFLNLNLI